MADMEMNPRLRVAPVPVEIQGQKALLIQDPERITEETVVLPLEAAAIIQFFDGTKSVREIQEEIMRLSGQLIDSEAITKLVDELDRLLLLESPRFFDHIKKLADDWRELKARPAANAGRAYPADKAELTAFLDAFYQPPDGPGPLPDAPCANKLKGIVAPHMDIRESGHTIARAFHVLAEQSEADLFVIFGTGHMEPRKIFIPSDKDYETPLGIARTDRGLVDKIAKLCKDRNPMNDYLHKQEHSIEFMVLFLQHALAGKRDFQILPILVAGMNPSVLAKSPPSADPSYRDFMAALKQSLAESGKKPCFIAGADLAHLGPRYGDKETWAPIRMGEEEQNDKKMLAPLAAGDKDGFFTEIANIQDKRKICGLPPIYAAMDAAGAEKAQTLKWSYWHDPDTHSIVSFVSMAMY